MNSLANVCKGLKLLILDVDGVLTDGTVYLDKEGKEFFKAFNVKDGYAIKTLAPKCGLKVAVITGRTSEIVLRRCEELGIHHLYQGQKDKMEAYSHLKNELGICDSEIAYMGDDYPDLPVLSLVGLPTAPCDASKFNLSKAIWISTHKGGRGAVRELIEQIMLYKGI